MIVLEPQIPWSLWWGMVVLAAAIWAWYALARDTGLGFLRRTFILVLMAAALVAPLLLLLNPTWVQPIVPPSGKPLITVLLDATQSMQVEDVEKRSRWAAAVEMAQHIRSSAEPQFDVNILRFGKILQSDDLSDTPPPDGSNTNLSAVIRQALAVNRPNGHTIALLSDGAHNVGSSVAVTAAADNARALDVPIYTTAFGGNVGATNVSLAIRNPQSMTFPDRSVNVRVQLSQRGFEGRQVTVRLLQEGQSIAAKRVRLERNGISETSFTLRPSEAGLMRYVAVVESLEGEATTADNQASLQVQVIDQPIRVLLLEGKPYWDSKFLAANLAADPSIELTSLIQIRPQRLMRRTDLATMVQQPSPTDQAAPESKVPESNAPESSNGWQVLQSGDTDWDDPEKLKEFRVVVLGRATEAFLDEASIERLRQWISHDGGALVCSRGAPTSELRQRLGQLLPIRWSDQAEFRARGELTSVGRSASLLPQDDAAVGSDPLMALPSLALGAAPSVAVGLPQVLVQSTSQDGRSVPIVSHQPYGSGQTVVVEGAGMWRWAFLPPEQAQAQKVYAELWQGLMQWLISQQELLPGQNVALRSDRLAFVTGDAVTASVLVRDPSQTDIPDCIVEGGQLELPRRATPVLQADQAGIYRIHFGVLPPGHYTARLVGRSPTSDQGSRGDTQTVGSQTVGSQTVGSQAAGSQAAGMVTEFDVRDPWFERLEVDARPGLLREIAARSGGRTIMAADARQIAEEYSKHLQLSRPEKSRRISLWDRQWVLLTVLGIWIGSWITRRHSGLV